MNVGETILALCMVCCFAVVLGMAVLTHSDLQAIHSQLSDIHYESVMIEGKLDLYVYKHLK